MLTKELTLTKENDSGKFEILFMALAYIPREGKSKSQDILRRERMCAIKLKKISVEDSNKRILKDGEQVLTLELPEIELLRKRIEEYPYWNPLADDSAIEVYDWINSGKEKND